MGNLSASEYAPKHTCSQATGHAIKCFIFVLFRWERSYWRLGERMPSISALATAWRLLATFNLR